MSITKIKVRGGNKYQVTFLERKVMNIDAEDVKEAGRKARYHVLNRGGRTQCTLLSVLPVVPSS